MMPLFIGFYIGSKIDKLKRNFLALLTHLINDPTLIEGSKKSQIDLKLFPHQKLPNLPLNNG